MKRKKEFPAVRKFYARSDAKVSSIERSIEHDYGLPRGSVRIVLPSGKDARGDKLIRSLIADWNN